MSQSLKLSKRYDMVVKLKNNQFSELNIDALHITDLIDKDLVLKQRQYHTPHAFNFARDL